MINVAVKIGHASISENGTIYGKAGDSTKREVCTTNWWNKPWDFIAIHPDEKVREKHAAAVEAACANDNIGYSQGERNTLNSLAKSVKYDLAKVTKKCNCDCSSLQNVCAVASGAKGVTYSSSNGWTTSTMKSKLKAAGYVIIEDKTYLTSSMYCVRGAIYVKAGSHTVCALDDGSKYKQMLSKAGISTTIDNKEPAKITTSTKKVTATVTADKGPDKSLAGTYTTTNGVHCRNGAGTKHASLCVIPKGTKVKCYGYYSLSGTAKWLYSQFTLNGVQYTGFVSSKYLKK